MKRYMNNLLKTLAICLFIPAVCIFIFFAGLESSKALHQLERIQLAKDYVKFSNSISTLIDNIQRERGISAGYLGANRGSLRKELDKARENTDAAYNSFLQYYEKDKTLFKQLEISEEMQTFISDYADLSQFRRDVDSGNKSVDEAISFPSKINEVLIDFAGEAHRVIDDYKVSNNLSAYVYFLKLKERSGQERGLLNGVFYQGGFQPGQYELWKSFKTDQETYLETTLGFLPAEQRTVFNRKLQGVAKSKVEEYRKTADRLFNAEMRNFGKEDWFYWASKRMEGMKALEESLHENVLSSLDQSIWDYQKKIGVDLLLIVLLMVISVSMLRSIEGVDAKQISQKVGGIIHFNISNKMLMAFLLLLVLIALNSVLSVSSMSRLSDLTNKLYNHPYTVSNAVLRIDRNIIKMHRSMKELTLGRSEDEHYETIERVYELENQIYGDFKIVFQQFLGEKRQIEEAYRAFSAWKPIRNEIIEAVKNNDFDKARQISNGKEAAYVDVLNMHMEGVVEYAHNKADFFIQNAMKEKVKSIQYAYWALLLTVVLAAFFTYVTSRSITEPLNKFEQDVNLIQETSDYSLRVKVNTNDEVGRLAKVFNQFMEHLQQASDAQENMTAELIVQQSKLENSFAKARTLSEKNSHLAALVENITDAIFSIDANGLITSWNKGAEELYGYSRSEILGRHIEVLLSDDNILKNLQLGGELTEHYSEHFETVNINKSNHHFNVDMKISTLITTDGEYIGYALLARDNTERKKSEAHLMDISEKAVASSRLKAQFLTNMSHELRTPLNGILGVTDLLCKSVIDSKQTYYTDLIKQSSHHLLKIIGDVLDYSEVEANNLTFEPEVFYVRDKISRLIQMYQFQAEDKNLVFKFDLDSNVPSRIVSDPKRFRQVISNLLSNAIKFTDDGEIIVEMKALHIDDSVAELEISVKDTGIGISKEAQQNIFESFYQVDSTTTKIHEGAGLGLSLSSRIATLMGGEIRVNSKKGDGSTFVFTMKAKLPSVNNDSDETLRGLQLGNLKVLVVDDAAINRNVISLFLTDWGINNLSVSNAQDALNELDNAAALGEPYDLLIADVVMPVMDGFQLVDKIKNTETVKDTKVIYVTGNGSLKDIDLIDEMQVDGYILKPILASDLFNTIKQIFASGQLLEAAHIDIESGTLDSISKPDKTLDILVVEDNDVNTVVLSSILKSYGYAVTVAVDGEQALEKYNRLAFDLILMDINIPEIDGLEITRKIRTSESHTDSYTPIIAVTANVNTGARERCLEVGMDGYVSKPYTGKDVLDEIKRVLETLTEDGEYQYG